MSELAPHHPCRGVHRGPIFIEGDVETCSHCMRRVTPAEATLARRVAGTRGNIIAMAFGVAEAVKSGKPPCA